MFKMQLTGLGMQHLAAWPRQISLSSFLTPFNFIILWSHHKRSTIMFTRLCLNPLSFPLLLIYGRQSHIFTQHIYAFMHLQNLFVKLTNKQHTCEPSITSVFTRCIVHHSWHLRCWPGPVRPATECWSSTVRTQTSEAAARSRSAVLITRRAWPGVASLGLSAETRWRGLAMIHPRENNTGTMQLRVWWWDTYTRESPHTTCCTAFLIFTEGVPYGR